MNDEQETFCEKVVMELNEKQTFESLSTSGYAQSVPKVNDRQLLWKIDLRLIPVLSVLYILAFLDRVNIGNAAVFGLKEDLNLTGNQFNAALVVFFAPFVLFEIPSNILLKKLKPHVWLSGCLFAFGLVTICQGLTQNYGGILTARIFLGLFESGILPGCFYLMSMWYKRSEAQKRFTFLFSGCTLAGAFGGLLASAIGKMDGMQGLLGWRWVFILEGSLTCFASFFFYFLIPDFPEAAKWLTSEEKAFLQAKLRTEIGTSESPKNITFRRVGRILSNYKVILGGLMYLGLIVTAYSFVYFVPTIILNYGHGAIRTQLLSVPPYACAFVFGMVVSTISDYSSHRFLFAFGCSCLAIVGYGILIVVHHNTPLQYGALFLVASGTYTAMPIVLCWFSMNVQGDLERGIAIGGQIGFGGVGGIISSYAFLAKDSPEFRMGYSIGIAFQSLSALAMFLYFVGVSVENRRKKAVSLTDQKEDAGSVLSFTYYT